eukprot:11271507-Ditylum_brightwellii.AAC.1
MDKVEFKFISNNQSDFCQEQSVTGCSVSSTGTVNGESNSNENLNMFPVHQPIINYFLNHNKSSYDQGYGSDGNVPFWDLITAQEGPD